MKNLKVIFILSLRSMLFILCFLFLSIATKTELLGLSKWWSMIVSFCNIITLIIIFKICKNEKINYQTLIKWKNGKTKISNLIITIILVLIIGISGMYFSGFLVYSKFPYMPIMLIEPILLWLAIINIFILPITTTMAEDGLYLGYSINRLNNKYIAIFMPAFFYAIQHSFIPLLFDWRYIVYRFLSFLPLTLLFCFWYYKKRNPIPIMVGHFVINLATVTQLVIMSANPALFNLMKTF